MWVLRCRDTVPVGAIGADPPPTRYFCVPLLSKGIRSWDIDLSCCNLDEQLKLFVSRHSATFSSIVKGKRGGHATLPAGI
uniref:Microtubule-associated protein 1B/S N-terminal domain-containing protein n=1 Tax=Buteo japonicus TaxID=224669 RepID=A0A8C0BKD0_9AVES